MTTHDFAAAAEPIFRQVVAGAKRDVRAALGFAGWLMFAPVWHFLIGPVLGVLVKLAVEAFVAWVGPKVMPLLRAMEGFFGEHLRGGVTGYAGHHSAVTEAIEFFATPTAGLSEPVKAAFEGRAAYGGSE